MDERRTSRSTNNSVAAMLKSHGDSLVSSSSNTSSLPRSATATSSSSFTLSQQDLAAAFSQALGESLPRILVAMQTHSTTIPSALAVSPLAGNVTPLSTSSNTGSTSSHSPSPAGHSSGNILSVPTFISAYCTLGNSSLCNPSITGAPSSCGAGSATSRTLAISGGHGSSLPLLGSSIPATSTICAMPSLNRPFVVGPGYSPIPEKLVTKIRTGQFVELADLLAENLKAQESEPHTYLDGKLLVSSSKKRVQEITDIITWVEAFTIFSWIFCSAHPSRWQDLTQYKLLIIKTSHQFPGKAWLHYDIAFRRDAAASGLTDWSRMNLDLYNFHTRSSPIQSGSSSNGSPQPFRFCRSWNDGSCRWPFGQCRFCHCCEKCEGDHPRVNCPFQASRPHIQCSRSATTTPSKRQRR